MFNESQRLIFKYYNGEKAVYADPLEIERKVSVYLDDTTAGIIVKAAGGEAVPPMAEFEANNKLLAVIRKVFAMKPFDMETGQGAMEADCFLAWNQWCSFMDEKKNPPEGPQSSPPPTAGPDHSVTTTSSA